MDRELAVLRALERLEDGALDVMLPDGTTRRFGLGEPLACASTATTCSAGSLFAGRPGWESVPWRRDWRRTTRPASSSS